MLKQNINVRWNFSRHGRSLFVIVAFERVQLLGHLRGFSWLPDSLQVLGKNFQIGRDVVFDCVIIFGVTQLLFVVISVRPFSEIGSLTQGSSRFGKSWLVSQLSRDNKHCLSSVWLLWYGFSIAYDR